MSEFINKEEKSELIDKALVVDATEVARGRWEMRFDPSTSIAVEECSLCHSEGEPWYKFCPGCGARMY